MQTVEQYPKSHLQAICATEKEALERADACISSAIIQEQAAGWCVFILELSPGKFA